MRQLFVDILTRTGLTARDAKVYLALLSLGEASVTQLAVSARIKRPTLYLVLDVLLERGYVSSHRSNRGKIFRALHPSILIEEAESNAILLSRALPELEQLMNTRRRPQMTVLEGRKGLKKALQDTLTAQGELVSWANVKRGAISELSQVYPAYVTERVRRKIFNREIGVYDEKALEYKRRDKQQLRELRLIAAERFPFSNHIHIYNDKFSILSYEDEVAVIIQSADIARSQRAIFDLAFEYAGLLERDRRQR